MKTRYTLAALTAVLSAVGGTPAAHAQTSATQATVHVGFDTVSDFNLFSYPASTPNTSISSFGFDSTTGVGTPDGAGVFQSTGGLNADKHVAAYYSGLSLDSNQVTSWTTSVMMYFPDLTTPTNGVKNNGEIRFGFFGSGSGTTPSVTASTPTSFSNINPSFFIKAKMEVSTTGASQGVISFEPGFSIGNGIEIAPSGSGKLKATHTLSDWYQFTLTINRDASGVFTGSAAMYDVGLDGTDAPLLLTLDGSTAQSYQTFSATNNSAFATDSHVYAGMILGGEKSVSWASNSYHVYADNFDFSAVPEPSVSGLLALAGAWACGGRRSRPRKVS